MGREDLSAYATEDALYHLSVLAELSVALARREGLMRCTRIAEALQDRRLTPRQEALLHYFISGAWEALRALSGASDDAWEREEVERGLVHLRLALRKSTLRELPRERVAQVLANLGAMLGQVGRHAEAVECWDRSLSVSPSFALARGRKGHALADYALAITNPKEAAIVIRYAHAELKTALSLDLPDDAHEYFGDRLAWIEDRYPREVERRDLDLHAAREASSEREAHYRQWCLRHRLFLNPLNDLGPYPFAARDVMHVPGWVRAGGRGAYFHGFYNQMKQAYVSARFLYWEAIQAEGPHFADRDVLLFDTLDCATHSLAAEKAKVAFEMAHGLFGKAAAFLDRYLSLGVPDERLSFRTLWYRGQRRDSGLREEVERTGNPGFRALFWLSKDLSEDWPGFRDSTEPEARPAAEILYHMKRGYVRLYDGDGRPAPGAQPALDTDRPPYEVEDVLACEVPRGEFEARTLRVLKLVRSALMYLALGVHRAEREAARDAAGAHAVPLDRIDDSLKV
jgi:tetratricopeptide (TPR) repeat protein